MAPRRLLALEERARLRRARSRGAALGARERVAAETDLPVKRRSSFEPEAAEEVKEDDKEEKKGFSMWESISAQVKSVFPAEEAPQSISRQNSPLHVEADV